MLLVDVAGLKVVKLACKLDCLVVFIKRFISELSHLTNQMFIDG
jgi:hypothetical protein